MRWLAVWLLLAGTYALGWLASRPLPGRGGAPAAEDLAHFAVIPLIQAVALAVVAAARAAARRRAPPPPRG